MSSLLRPAAIDDPRELVELVAGAIGEIVGGGVLLHGALGNEEFGYFDLVAANGDGEVVLYFINISGSETEYLRLLKCLRWYQENRGALQKLHAGRFALGPVPPVFVVAPWFSSSMQKVLSNIREGRITLLKYVCFQDGKEKKLFIEKVEDPPSGSGKANPVKLPETFPHGLAADPPKIQPAETMMDLRRLREESGTDISNVSDEELLDLLG
jgi:hypothetical protein